MTRLPTPTARREPYTHDGRTLLPCLRAGHVHHTFMWPDCNCRRQELPASARAKSCGALATDHEGMYRAARVARARESIESAVPGFLKGWDRRVARAKRKAGAR